MLTHSPRAVWTTFMVVASISLAACPANSPRPAADASVVDRPPTAAAVAPDAGSAGTPARRREGCGGDDYEKRVLAKGGWVEHRDDVGSCCIATPATRADGCSVTVSTKDVKVLDGGVVALKIGDGQADLSCGEEKAICGRLYRCECQKCSDTPAYATRMQRGRRLVPERGSSRQATVTVEYEGGACVVHAYVQGAGGLDQTGRTFWICEVAFDDVSTVGGCTRHASGGESLKCGEAFNACDGVVVRCECSDGNGTVVTADEMPMGGTSGPSPQPSSGPSY